MERIGEREDGDDDNNDADVDVDVEDDNNDEDVDDNVVGSWFVVNRGVTFEKRERNRRCMKKQMAK